MATPIGNLADIGLRALAVLRGADLIACEDTRITSRLLDRYGIATPTTAYYDHNAAKVRPRLLARLAEGAVLALVSDAGTPLISDPGYRLVREAVAQGTAVHPVPGPSSVLAALCLSGLPTDRFMFAGFLPSRQAARRRELESLAEIPATLVFFESATRLAAALADMAAVLGDRESMVGRELTKRFEEARRGHLGALAAEFAGRPVKGEVVVVVGPPGEPPPASAEDIDALLRVAMSRGSLREAVDEVVGATGQRRRAVYERALRLNREMAGK